MARLCRPYTLVAMEGFCVPKQDVPKHHITSARDVLGYGSLEANACSHFPSRLPSWLSHQYIVINTLSVASSGQA